MSWIFIFLTWPMHKYDLTLDLPELEFTSFSSSLFVSFSLQMGLCRAGSPCCGSLQVSVLLSLTQDWMGCLAVLEYLFPDHDGSLASSLLTWQPSYQHTRKAMQIVTTLPGHPAWYPGLGILSWEGWERCPIVCSRLLGKIQGFS